MKPGQNETKTVCKDNTINKFTVRIWFQKFGSRLSSFGEWNRMWYFHGSSCSANNIIHENVKSLLTDQIYFVI